VPSSSVSPFHKLLPLYVSIQEYFKASALSLSSPAIASATIVVDTEESVT